MENIVNYMQQKGKNKIQLELNADYLNYIIEDENSDGSFQINYEDIPNDRSRFTEQNKSYKNYAIYTLIIGLIFTLSGIPHRVDLLDIGFFVASTIFFVLYNRSVINYTRISTEKTDIYLLRDQNHDKILTELYSARNKYLMTNYGDINHQNDTEQELRKFNWLKKMGVITQERFDSINVELLTKSVE